MTGQSAAPRYPETVLQFGTGVFLLGFVDWIIHRLNRQGGFNAGVVACKARPGGNAQLEALNRHQGAFHVWLRGSQGGERVDRLERVDCLSRAINPFSDFAAAQALAQSPDLRWVVSNTTESGLQYRADDCGEGGVPASFPAMMTTLLYQRFRHFDGAADRGLILLCCELVENNAQVLASIIRQHARDWGLPESFLDWLEAANTFCNTLVDRIVTGEPGERPAAEDLPPDALVIEAEVFHAWVIEAPAWVETLMPVAATGLNVQFVENLGGYRERKVRILNGAHTGCVAISLMLGIETVYETTRHALLQRYLRQLVYGEICPTLGEDQEDVLAYARSILERFENPFVEHRWANVALNSLSKWRTRLLAPLQETVAAGGQVPPLLVLSLSALLVFYRGRYGDRELPLNDSDEIRETLTQIVAGCRDAGAAATAILAEPSLWGGALDLPPQVIAAVVQGVEDIDRLGLEQAIELRLAAADQGG